MNHLPFHHFKNQRKGGLMAPYNGAPSWTYSGQVFSWT